MEANSILERKTPAAKHPAPAGNTDYALNAVLVYQDEQTRTWAREVCDRVTCLLGEQSLRATWWNLHELNEPAVLAGAVSKTMRSDVILIALRAAEQLPLAFYVWADTWLPHRPQQAGALVALIGQPEHPHPPSDRARQYLNELARRGRLDFLLEERKLPAPKSDSTPRLLCDSTPARHPAPPQPRRGRIHPRVGQPAARRRAGPAI